MSYLPSTQEFAYWTSTNFAKAWDGLGAPCAPNSPCLNPPFRIRSRRDRQRLCHRKKTRFTMIAKAPKTAKNGWRKAILDNGITSINPHLKHITISMDAMLCNIWLYLDSWNNTRDFFEAGSRLVNHQCIPWYPPPDTASWHGWYQAVFTYSLRRTMDRWIIKKKQQSQSCQLSWCCLDVPQYVEKLLKLTQ